MHHRVLCHSDGFLGEIYMIFYAVVIMKSVQYPVFLIKSNHNIMAAICIYLLTALPYNNSVHHTITVNCWYHIMCHFMQCFIFFSDDRNQDVETTDKHINLIIGLLKNRTVLFADMINIQGNTDGSTEQYHRANAVYLSSMLAHAYNIIIDCSVGAPGHGREVVGGFNDKDKRLI